MDDRQQQIREGAGLTESKLNVEFIDFLKKWSTPTLLVIAAVALGIVVYQRLERARAEELNTAFREFETAGNIQNPNPESLKAIAEQFSGVAAVPHLARLRAGDEYLKAIRLGLRLGAQPRPDGTYAPEEILTEQDKARYLDDARALFQRVLDDTAPATGKSLHAISAAHGLAAVAEVRGDLDAARAAYERVSQLADRAGLRAQVEIAKRRIESLPRVAQMPRVFAEAEIPQPPPPPAPPPQAADPPPAASPTSSPPR